MKIKPKIHKMDYTKDWNARICWIEQHTYQANIVLSKRTNLPNSAYIICLLLHILPPFISHRDKQSKISNESKEISKRRNIP